MSAQQDDDIATVAATRRHGDLERACRRAGRRGRCVAMAPAGATCVFIAARRHAAAFEKGQPLIETAAYKVHASRREAAGMAEVHARDTDIIYVLEGRATVVTGGTVVDAKATAPDEMRGARIEGGTARTLAKGDVLIVPERRAALVQRREGTVALLRREGDAAGGDVDGRRRRDDAAHTPARTPSRGGPARRARGRGAVDGRRQHLARASAAAPAASPAASIDLATRRRRRLVKGSGATATRGSSRSISPVPDPMASRPARRCAPTTTRRRPAAPASTIRSGTVIDPTTLTQRRSTGRICFNWYRIAVTIPERIGGYDPTGADVVFETALDDYAEIWVDGELPRGARPDGRIGRQPDGTRRIAW